MPHSLLNRLSRRAAIAVGATMIAAAGLAAVPATSMASHSELAIIQDGNDLVNPSATFAQFRALGANTVRVVIPWYYIAPKSGSIRKPNFNAANPNAYPAAGWVPYDNIDRAAAAYGLKLDFTVTGGAPRWAEGGGVPNHGDIDVNFAWKPNAKDYGQFMQAVGTRYGGKFTPTGAGSPLPAVKFWTIFNEPNFGEDLGPEAIDNSHILYAPMLYRNLVAAGWTALQRSGHRGQTILIGDFAARGFYLSNGSRPGAPQGYPGNFGQTRPLYFIRTLYCVGSSYRPLTGTAARQVGCPTTAAARRAFRRRNPGLFDATGVGDHPYPTNGTPVNDGKVADYATFPELGNLGSTLNRALRAYGSHKQYPIYNDEFGYITDPPNVGLVTNQPSRGKGHYLTPSTAAIYINWAEYLSWRNPRIASYMQYLLEDPSPTAGAYSGFASGLETDKGVPKETYDAYRLPVYMPKTSVSRSGAEVWGDARPAPFMAGDAPQSVAIQFNDATVATVTPGRGGYFDTTVKFPSSGTVRLAYTYPTTDPLLPVGDLGQTVYSRSFSITVH